MRINIDSMRAYFKGLICHLRTYKDMGFGQIFRFISESIYRILRPYTEHLLLLRYPYFIPIKP